MASLVRTTCRLTERQFQLGCNNTVQLPASSHKKSLLDHKSIKATL